MVYSGQRLYTYKYENMGAFSHLATRTASDPWNVTKSDNTSLLSMVATNISLLYMTVLILLFAE